MIAKFLCVKGILFFSFWQGLAVSLLVAIHAIKRCKSSPHWNPQSRLLNRFPIPLLVGAYTDNEHMSLALTDSLVCLEMHFYAVSHVGRCRVRIFACTANLPILPLF